MAKYAVGISTQNKIVDCCRTLFYQKGITGTSYDEICSAASVNRGLIPYYFKSKNNIATQIFQKVIEDCDNLIRDIVTKNISSVDENVQFVVNNALLYDLMKRDPNFCRFYNEIESNSFWSEMTLQLQYSLIDKLIHFNCINMQPDVRCTIACLCEGMEQELIHGIHSNFLTEDAWMLAVRDCTCIFSLMGFSQEQVESCMKQSKCFFDQYYFCCKPDFSISMHTRDQV